jgi:hypothetical protein
LSEIDIIDEYSYKGMIETFQIDKNPMTTVFYPLSDSITIMQLLRDNLTVSLRTPRFDMAE